jgi:aryl-alcohol dehydrogenase
VLGHEGAGVVEAVGAYVSSVAPGDHVVMSFTSCGSCSLCLTGAPAYCRNFWDVNFTGRRPDGTTAISCDGVEVNGHFLGQSSFASHAVVPERAVVRIDKDHDLARISPFGCGFQTGAGAVMNVLRPGPGASLAVFGAGAVGTAAIIAASLAGCAPLVAVDVNAEKLAAAAEFGATHQINSAQDDAAGALADLVPHGFDFVIDATGHADVLRTAVEALGPLGRAAVVGVGPSETMTFEWRSILNGRTVTGVVAGSSLPRVFLPQLLDLHRQGRFPVDRLMRQFRFEEINDAIAAVRAGSVGKAVLTFEGV